MAVKGAQLSLAIVVPHSGTLGTTSSHHAITRMHTVNEVALSEVVYHHPVCQIVIIMIEKKRNSKRVKTVIKIITMVI